MAPKSPWNKKTTINTNAQKAATEQAASPAINYGEVQTDEIEALKAIYMEDYEEVETKSAWSKTTDRSFRLRLRSFSEQESSVVLSVKLTATYPRSVPMLELAGLDSYHERTQKRVRNIVQNRPKHMLGEVMMYAIASEIQEALEDAVQAKQQGTLPSLEEERASAEEVANALAKEAEEAEARLQREAQEEEDRVLKRMVDEELNRRERRKSVKAPPPLASQPSVTDEDIVTFDQTAIIQVRNDRAEFNAVTLVGALSRKRDEQLYLGKPQIAEASAHALVAVKKLNSNKSRDEIMQVESMLEAVTNLRHSSILGLLAYRVDRIDVTASQIVLCSEYADRGTLHELLELGGLHVDKAKQFTIQMLEALDYLHHHGVAHGNLTANSVFLHSTPSLAPKLGQLGQWMLQSYASPLPQKWQPTEGADVSGSMRRKSDIWYLGVIVVQIFLGSQAVTDYLSPHVMLGRLYFSDAFDDFARKLFATDVRKRPSAFDLLPVEFLRTDAPVMETAPVLSTPRHRKSGSGVMSPAKRRSRHNSSSVLEPMSRYAADFTEMGRLGKGGFGEVVKARNKLDGGIYAVKKVKQAPQLLDQVLSEVMLLNRLNHPYVVRYFSTWVETDVSGAIEEEETTTTTEETTTDTSSDEPRMDFGFQSAGGLDFVSSSGYAGIEFGEDDEDEEGSDDEDAAEDLDEKPSTNGASTEVSEMRDLRMPRPRSDNRRPPSILYIQMEFCERRTLRDLIRKSLSADDSWRFVRQITEGLAHIHGHGIIHRDLKPDNIFIDVAGSPKIGDFGLATTSQYHFIERAATMSGHSGGGDMTRSVGTALYVAPELKSVSGGAYNDKVDMYSLGIMFFEMCEEFGTAFERIKAIQQIREKNHSLPAVYYANGEKAAQGKLIDCLISHKPSERPSSTELLRSDVLPIKVEDEAVRQALSSLSDTRSPYHQKMMSALFAPDSIGAGRVKALAWDAKGDTVTEDANRLRLRTIARQKLESVFRRHGAEEARRPTVFPRSGYYTNANVVQLLDASGNILQLPYDLTLPHARQLARHTPTVKRTFVFASAYRDAFSGGPPKASEEVDFDITSSRREDDSTFDDAEVLKVMDEVACEMPAFASASNICFYLNHAAILDSILENCRVPTAQQSMVKEAISRLGFHQWTWAKVRTELRKLGLPDTTLDDMQQFDFQQAPEKAFTRLQELFETAPSRLQARMERGIRSLTAVIQTAGQLSVQRPLQIAPLGSVNAKFYEDGMLFQCVLERKTNKTVIAAGGRYDSLTQAHRAMNAPTTCKGAVGVSIGLDPILTYMSKSSDAGKSTYLKDRRQPEAQPKRCDVLVEASGTEAAHTVAIRILTALWANKISAELVANSHSSNVSVEHSFVVTVRHEASNTVRVSSTASDADEVDVPITSLVSHLQQELKEKESSKARPPAFVRQTSHHDAADRRGNVQVLMAQHRSKKSNKYHIVEAAQQRWTEKVDEWKDAPILAVETRDDVLELVRDSRLGDAESWRRAVQSVQLNERQYLQQVQDILSSWRKKWVEGNGEREACVFNFRTGHCIYYDLGL